MANLRQYGQQVAMVAITEGESVQPRANAGASNQAREILKQQ